MLRWCAYCQEFQGEIPPFDVFTTTHGLCEDCKARGMAVLDDEVGNSHRLREIQGLLHRAGKTGDVPAAASIVRSALESGLRPVDILIGIVTPLLHQIGDEWAHGQITIADQQRFSAFCERVFELVQVEVKAAVGTPAACLSRVFLMNARGNDHTLGIRTVGLLLESKGIETRVFDPPITPAALIHMAVQSKPQAILISLALAGQRPFVCDIALRVGAMPSPSPVLFVGGNAIKHNLVAAIAGAIFLEGIAGLPGMILALN